MRDGDYEIDDWFDRARGLENEPERGARCSACFDMRFEKTAAFARARGFFAHQQHARHFALERYGANQSLRRARGGGGRNRILDF